MQRLQCFSTLLLTNWATNGALRRWKQCQFIFVWMFWNKWHRLSKVENKITYAGHMFYLNNCLRNGIYLNLSFATDVMLTMQRIISDVSVSEFGDNTGWTRHSCMHWQRFGFLVLWEINITCVIFICTGCMNVNVYNSGKCINIVQSSDRAFQYKSYLHCIWKQPLT